MQQEALGRAACQRPAPTSRELQVLNGAALCPALCSLGTWGEDTWGSRLLGPTPISALPGRGPQCRRMVSAPCQTTRLLFSRSVVSDSLWPHGVQTARLLCPWDSPGQNIWSGLPFPSPSDLHDPGIEPASPALTGGFFPTESTGKPELLPPLKNQPIRLDFFFGGERTVCIRKFQKMKVFFFFSLTTELTKLVKYPSNFLN